MTPSTPSPTIRRHSQTGGWVTQTLIPEFLSLITMGRDYDAESSVRCITCCAGCSAPQISQSLRTKFSLLAATSAALCLRQCSRVIAVVVVGPAKAQREMRFAMLSIARRQQQPVSVHSTRSHNFRCHHSNRGVSVLEHCTFSSRAWNNWNRKRHTPSSSPAVS